MYFDTFTGTARVYIDRDNDYNRRQIKMRMLQFTKLDACQVTHLYKLDCLQDHLKGYGACVLMRNNSDASAASTLIYLDKDD